MTTWFKRYNVSSPDQGSALVAAMGVAIIGIALTTLVVMQAMIVTNDAQRDRVRTSEVHAAEAAVDTTMYSLQSGAPCTIAPLEVGVGTNAMDVTVDIEYFDETGAELTTCVAGEIDGDPVRAVVTAHAVPGTEAPGLAPERTVQSVVELTPVTGLSIGTSIFAGNQFYGVNSGTIVPSDPAFPAGVWIDSGNYQCSNSFLIDGHLIVPTGSITMSNTCSVTGNAWAKTGFQSSNSPSGWRVGGDTTVRNGNFNVGNATQFGGNLSVNGDITGWFFKDTEVAGSICSNNINSPCTSFTEYVPRGLPRVDMIPSDWVGFTYKPLTGATDSWTQDIVDTWGMSASRETQFRNNPCRLEAALSSKVINLTNEKSIYDLTSCAFSSANKVTIRLFEDTVIFSRGFTVSNQFSIESGDGNPHNVWLIVPSGGAPGTPTSTACYGSYCPSPGTINLSNQTTIKQPVTVFMYTPAQINISNNTDLWGQIYGQNVQISNNFKLTYVGMGIPGVDLGGGIATAADGFHVEVLKKREISE